MHWMYGWDWLLLSVGMGVWLFVLGLVAYAAVRSALRPPSHISGPRYPRGV